MRRKSHNQHYRASTKNATKAINPATGAIAFALAAPVLDCAAAPFVEEELASAVEFAAARVSILPISTPPTPVELVQASPLSSVASSVRVISAHYQAPSAWTSSTRRKNITHIVQCTTSVADLDELQTCIRTSRYAQISQSRSELRDAEAAIAGLVEVFHEGDVEVGHVVPDTEVDVRESPWVGWFHGD